jgi:hypothetical protein
MKKSGIEDNDPRRLDKRIKIVSKESF